MLDAAATVSFSAAAGSFAQQANAIDPPFADESFDTAACQFGVMFFFPTSRRAIARVRRVLRPGGYYLHHSARDAVASNASFLVLAGRPGQIGFSRRSAPLHRAHAAWLS